MPSLTPIRVRGKRTAAKDEKWNAGKKRKASRLNTLSPSVVADDASCPPTRKRKRRTRTLAFVEELPTEILQNIFYFSGNLNLALASTSLQSQLSSKHVYLAHTTRLLQPLLGHEGTEREDTDIAAASRLLSCRFFTWDFFKTWLVQRSSNVADKHASEQSLSAEGYLALWQAQQPSPRLLPPLKVLHGPWTRDKVEFLTLMAVTEPDLPSLSPIHGEAVYLGLNQAVAERSFDAVAQLLRFKPNLDTEILRKAVIDNVFNRDVVLKLADYAVQRQQESISSQADISVKEMPAVDFLDPALWAWAERARNNDNENGEWLSKLLKDKSRQVQPRTRSVQQPADEDATM
ncbi:hypothetical protein KC360_g3633 [Hortaea werneckii]|nr:hypothetical protein KC325_g3534 [Hortaea werneckii]KAI6997236.1 hypothetical protein KC359_g3081 [Hortaea werneckii]KAI7146983.1 hypothetical protein KC344_g3187 [Hortaea werneckii]KAI7175483.1 hypothetical protein KC360_g3633 [Hortaea werneckii]